MTGIGATWYDAKRNMDRLPEYADPEVGSAFLDKTKGRLAAWLERRLKERLES